MKHSSLAKISICGTHELMDSISNDVDYVVSIMDPGSPELEALQNFPEQRRLALRFHDVVEPNENLVPPQVDHIERLLAFGRSITRNSQLLVHCFAGISRSTAAAILLHAQDNPSEPPEEAVKQATLIVPNAWPNWRMIQIGDDLLGRSGLVRAAVKRHYLSMNERYPDFIKHLSNSSWDVP